MVARVCPGIPAQPYETAGGRKSGDNPHNGEEEGLFLSSLELEKSGEDGQHRCQDGPFPRILVRQPLTWSHAADYSQQER